MDDEGIRAAFHDAGTSPGSPVEQLVAGAIARGRRRSLVTRVAAALSMTAAIGGAVGLVGLLPGRDDPPPAAIGAGGASFGAVVSTDSAATRTATEPPGTPPRCDIGERERASAGPTSSAHAPEAAACCPTAHARATASSTRPAGVIGTNHPAARRNCRNPPHTRRPSPAGRP